MKKRFDFVGLEAERFNALSGNILHYFKDKVSPYFKNVNYIGCNLSHINMYQNAIDRGFSRVLIIEDDVRLHKDFSSYIQHLEILEDKEWDLLYFAYIPLSDDTMYWNYNVFQQSEFSNVAIPKNFWSLMGYVISEKLMKHMIAVYSNEFPMEVDRYFVNFIQPNSDWKCYASSPQLVCAEDGESDNSGIAEIQMMERSVDSRYARLHDYI